MTHVLSFVAEAPFERRDGNCICTLTHVLPLVSQQFCRISLVDTLWKQALLRQAKRESGLWMKALNCLLRGEVTLSRDNDNNNNVAAASTPGDVIDRILSSLQNNGNATTCIEIYKTILNNFVLFGGLIFSMPQQISIGTPYELHFSEPRYRRLIAQD